MAVRIKEGMIPYKWGDGIEITNNHIINVLLREANNLIHMNENRELYVDLQLDDWIAPDDDFPVGVTTGKILAEDWWQQSWLILNWKTTSGDYARLIYANDWNLYVDLWDWVWILLGWAWRLNNVQEFTVASTSDSTTWQAVVDWYLAWNYPVIVYNGTTYLLETNYWTPWQAVFVNVDSWTQNYMNNGYSYISRSRLWLYWTNDWQFDEWETETVAKSWDIIFANMDYTVPFIPQTPWDPATKKYVDDGLATKQDILTPWTRINIQVDPVTWDTVISADISSVMTYMWNVASPSQLPSSWQQQWDCWYDETDHTLWAWDWTQWKDVGGTGIDLTNYFNMQVNNSDDITEWSIHLFCTSIEKNYWNSKQDPLTAWNGIDITSNVISAKYTAWSNISIDNNFAINNDAPFEPDNAWTLWQLLQKTSNGYEWRTLNYVSSVNWQSWPVTVDEFDPENTGTTGQVLKKTNTGYQWENETAGSYTGWTGINVNQSTKQISNTLPFNPTNTWSAWQVIKLNQDWVTYSWQNDESWWGWGWGGTTYYGWDYITIDSSHYINNTAPFLPSAWGSTWQVLTKTSGGYTWDDVELPSGENNVKFWTVNSQWMTSSSLRPIFEWVNADVHNWAILNDSVTQDAFIFNQVKTINWNPTAVFLGKKRNSEARLWAKGYYTAQYENEVRITYSNGGYAITLLESEDDNTKTNYISALPLGYTAQDAFMPTADYEPATKKYVDSAIQWWWTPYTAWAWISIANNQISNIWVLSGDSWVVYTVKVSSSAPASWTPNTTITFRT